MYILVDNEQANFLTSYQNESWKQIPQFFWLIASIHDFFEISQKVLPIRNPCDARRRIWVTNIDASIDIFTIFQGTKKPNWQQRTKNAFNIIRNSNKFILQV